MQAIRKARRIFYGYVIDIARSANQLLEENFVISKANDFIVTDIVGNASSNSYRLQMRDSINGFQWSDGLINAGNIVGSAQHPFKLPRTKWVQKNGIIYYKVQDFSGAPNTIQLVLFGYEKYTDLQDVSEVEEVEKGKYEYFSIPFNSSVLGNASDSIDVQISSGYDFLVTHITGTKTGIYNLNLIDSNTNRNWIYSKVTNRVNDVNLVGTNEYPFILPRPKWVKGGSIITLSLTDTSTNPNDIQVVLHGYRIPA